MNLLRTASKAIDRFWFDAPAPIMCSVIRIAYAVLLLTLVVFLALDADMWFTESGVLTIASARELTGEQYWSLFFWLPPQVEFVYAGLSILMVQSLLLMFGCWSRFQAACIFVWLTSFQHRNPLIFDGEDTVFRLLAFFMIFMPLDYAWSLLRTLRSGTRSTPPPSAWALRLVQFEVTAIYLSTAWSKWQGVTWRDGTALYYVSRMEDVFGRGWLPAFMFETQWILKMSTWGVLGAESLLPFLLWFPRTRRLGILLAIGLHLSIEYSMHLFLFEWIMIVGLLAFVRPSEWIAGRPKLREASQTAEVGSEFA